METVKEAIMNEPTASNAATSLAAAERIAALVRARTSQNVIAWLAAIAVASAFYLTGVGAAGQNWVWVAMLSGLLGTVIMSVTGLFFSTDVMGARAQMRRWWRVVLVWLLVFGAALGVGLPLFSGQLWFWLPIAVVSTVPLVVGIALEVRR
jgi:hypothetical protein